MQNRLKITVCVLLLLVLAGPTEAFASRYMRPSSLCQGEANRLLRALEVHNMGDDPIVINGVRPVDREFLAQLVKGGDLNNADAYFALEKQHNCKFYLVQADKNVSPIIICRKHGMADQRDSNFSPKQQFELYCREHSMEPGAYNVDLSDEVVSDVGGSRLMAHIATLWPVFMILPVIFFVIVIRRCSGGGAIAGAYLFGTSVVAFLLILSAINIYYVGDPIPGFRRFTYGSYPDGAKSLSVVTFYALVIWWLISLLNTLASAVRKKEFMLPLVYTSLLPLALLLVESQIFHMFQGIVAMSFPLLGAFLLYLILARSQDK